MRMQKSMCITVNLFIYSFSVLVLGEASDHDYIHLCCPWFSLCALCSIDKICVQQLKCFMIRCVIIRSGLLDLMNSHGWHMKKLLHEKVGN
jgi:hypothetical protein